MHGAGSGSDEFFGRVAAASCPPMPSGCTAQQKNTAGGVKGSQEPVMGCRKEGVGL